ncbi:MAG: chromate transporter [Burkholderiales bacterium]
MTSAWLPSLQAALGLHGLGGAELWGLFVHFLSLSLLAMGGAIATVPDMHRYLVGQHGWLSDAEFTGSVALAQAAPGPNVLFVAVLGWNVAGVAGMLAAMLGIMVPSCTLAWLVNRWGTGQREARWMQLFTAGLTPLTIGLLCATGWVLTEPVRPHPATWALIAITLVVMLRTRWSPLWLIALGGVVGACGWV